ncbi:uncharacterized protein VTP21DRAFT_1009 [Calcarisporiella thermophila]|uniref:uncharacterized protein n=1 Tax=Calcarisporiella thermophila TaxID=911321 RepID=UPI003744B192
MNLDFETAKKIAYNLFEAIASFGTDDEEAEETMDEEEFASASEGPSASSSLIASKDSSEEEEKWKEQETLDETIFSPQQDILKEKEEERNQLKQEETEDEKYASDKYSGESQLSLDGWAELSTVANKPRDHDTETTDPQTISTPNTPQRNWHWLWRKSLRV